MLAMRDELGVDMSGFDCGDSILPESTLPAPACLAVLFIGLVLYAALPAPCGVIGLLAGLIVVCLLDGSSKSARPELRVRDLLNAVEAGRWVSPKA